MKKQTPREELTQIVLEHPEICDQLLVHLSTMEIYSRLNDENKHRFEERLLEIAAAEGAQ